MLNIETILTSIIFNNILIYILFIYNIIMNTIYIKNSLNIYTIPYLIRFLYIYLYYIIK